jgi:hypothetical protein
MTELILASKNLKIMREILNYIPKLPRVIAFSHIGEITDFYIESKEDGTFYYYLKSKCKNILNEYIKGFCCGYMAGKDFDNSF